MATKRKEYKSVNSNMIKIADYQRPLRMPWVNKIVSEWNDLKAHAPKVSYRDGAYWVFDGQHTLTARLVRNKMKPLSVECEVYYGLTKEEEAELFVSLNRERKKVTANEETKGLFIAGDEATRKMIDIIEKHGYTASYSAHMGVGKICALAKTMSIMTKEGEDALDWVLDVLSRSWPDDAQGTRCTIIGGLNEIYKTYKNDVTFNKSRFIERMRLVSPSAIIREGNELTVGGDRRFAKRMAYYYNKGLKTNKLDVSKLEI